ncbi:hypothetical protein FOVG_18088 [Fusarium oxysporum f. sp. pisi HDV247]|uniref:Uncharacterized protein n=1 Tax=Fusarium oxysporum f. sp. pisi HDV247 TaxID=1080344 RepID=W9NCR9_FUSOX|nr:hypothetical protein FOVG_18088 [Fusarium oxysporum f. sp. pisi HDV247]
MSGLPISTDAVSFSDEKRDGEKSDPTLDRVSSHGNGIVVTVDGTDAATLHNHEVINKAIKTIGFGRFQWQLTFSCGFGFLVD